MNVMKRSWLCYLLFLLAAGALYIMKGSYETLIFLGCLLTIPFWGAVACVSAGRKLELTWKEEDGQGMIRISNRSWFPVWKGRVCLSWENRLTGEAGMENIPFAALSKSTVWENVELQTEFCGTYRIRAEKVQVFDLLTLFCRLRKVSLSAECQVYPKTDSIQINILQKERYDMESFQYAQQRAGEDAAETFDIREYRIGDSVRKIHWKLTGKMDAVMLRESSYPVFHAVLLLLETGYRADKRPSAQKMDAAVCVFVSAAEKMLADGMKFEIGFFDYDKQMFWIHRIETQDDLWNGIPDLLRAGCAESEESAYDQFISWNKGQRYAQYIYVTAQDSYELAAWADSGMERTDDDSLCVLCCSDSFGQGENEVRFTAEHWREELA